MFKHILFATDLTPASNALLHCIGPLRTLGAEKATLLHVLNIRDVGGLYISMKQLIEPHIQVQVEELRKAGLETRSDTALGRPAYEINRYAVERGVSVIVAGTHGESMLKEILLGSVTRDLLQIAQKPVLLVPTYPFLGEESASRCGAACRRLFEHVLFATDFSDSARWAFQYLEHAAAEAHPEVTFFHVQDLPRMEPYLKPMLGQFDRIDTERLKLLEEGILAKGARKTSHAIAHGRPDQLLVQRANSGPFSLLILGTQGRSYLPEAFLGRVAHYVAHHVDIPILFIPLTAPPAPSDTQERSQG